MMGEARGWAARARRGGYLGQAWLVLLLALGFGGLLAAVQLGWGPRIEQNKKEEALRQIPELLADVSVEVDGQTRRLTAVGALTEEIHRDGKVIAYKGFWQDRRDGEFVGPKVHVGWVVRGKGNGYADVIELLVGLDRRAERITGLYVLAQNETPGLGNKIKQPAWRGQFAGLSARKPVEVRKSKPAAGSNAVRAVGGATISSRSVADIVNQAVRDFRKVLPTLPADGTQPDQAAAGAGAPAGDDKTGSTYGG